MKIISKKKPPTEAVVW